MSKADGRTATARRGLEDALDRLPQLPQRQDSTEAQLRDLVAFANKLGLYDAADFIRTVIRER